MKIKKFEFLTSVYSVVKHNGRLYVGGSDWDRRKIVYSKKIAEESKGRLWILKKNKIEKEIEFPSMVYAIVPLSKNKLFVGCKSNKRAFNLIDKEGNLIKSKDDSVGKGVYNAVLDGNKINLTTRSGKLEIIDKDLKIKKQIQLSSKGTRLWSLKVFKNKIYCGDYDGNLYVVKERVNKFNLKEFYDENKKFGPSLWGLEVLKNKIILGTRWGDVFVLNEDFGLIKKVKVNEDVSCLEKFSKEEILVGTRYGKLFVLDLKNYKLKKILEIKPKLQKENAIWGMNKNLVCFADGVVAIINN